MPISLRRSSSFYNAYLELFLHKNHYQLATENAYYSDGLNYAPAFIFIDNIKESLQNIKNVLILGAGVGSTIQILNSMGYYPEYTIVDIDEVVLNMAVECVQDFKKIKLNPVCTDAKEYVKKNSLKYDLIFIDVFHGRDVPEFVTSTDFLINCGKLLNKGSFLVLNYIINDPVKWIEDKETFTLLYPQYKILPFDINRIFLATT